MSPALAGWAAFGLFVGAYGTLVGAGGGFLVVPVLMWVAGADPAVAAGTSLVVVLFNACSGTVTYARRGQVDWRTALLFAAATLPGAWLGPRLLAGIPKHAFQIAFGALLLALAAFLLLRPTAPPEGGGPPTRRGLMGGALFSLGIGFLSSLLGIGGGFLHVPFLIYALRFPPSLAISTSQATLVFTAAAGVAGHARLGHVRWELALPIGLGALAGAQAGVWLARRAKVPTVIRALAVAVALVGLRCLWMGLHP